MSEVSRDLMEMGKLVHPETMQNILVGDNQEYLTKEYINYSYAISHRALFSDENYLNIFSDTSQEWQNAEFAERVNPETKNPGKAYLLRESVWKGLLNPSGKFDYTYSGRIAQALPDIIEHLKENPNSRQAILTVWWPWDVKCIGGIARVPCSIYYQFLIRDKAMHIIYNQRSSDIITHFGNDIWMAGKLLGYVSEMVGTNKPGMIYHNITSLHAYKKDWPRLDQGISELRGMI